MNFSRLFKQLTFVLLATALLYSAFAQEHGKVFPITTTATSYSLEDNSYVDGDVSSGIRFVFVAPNTGLFNMKFELPSGGDYYVNKCTSDAYSSCSRVFEVYGTGSYANRYQNISVAKGDTAFYIVAEYSSSYNTKLINLSYEEIPTYTVKINGKDTAIATGNSLAINASTLLSPNKAFVKWKIISGSGTFGNETAISTNYKPQANSEIGIETKVVTVYPITDKYSSYVYDSQGYAKTTSAYAVRTSYSAADSGYYVLFVKAGFSSSVYRYGTDSTFASASTTSCSSGLCRILFYSVGGVKNYFELYEGNSSYTDSSVSVRVEKTVKVTSDTSGSGYVYVGTSSLNFDSTHVAGDTVNIKGYSYTGAKFNHWEKVSGQCTILDSTKAISQVKVDGDCRVKAVFAVGTVYSITSTATDYTTADNYYSSMASNGVRFKFIAPSDGAFAISFTAKDTSDKFYFIKYPNSAFSSYTWQNLGNKKIDSLYLNKNDTVYYLVRTYSNYDSLDVFTVKSSSIASYKVTLTTASQCSTSVKTDYVVGGGSATYFGYATSGFRPAGFNIKKGTGSFTDSLPNTATIVVKSDITLELKCDPANLIAITTKETYRSADKDFYDVDPSNGMRYVYISPTTSIYAIRAKTKLSNSSYFTGYYYNYGKDSSFTSSLRSFNMSSSYVTRTFFIEPSSTNENFYFSVIPSGSAYYDDLIAVYAIEASVVDVEGRTYPDTIAMGDPLSISAVIDTGYNFVGWKLTSGSGKFSDSTAFSTTFTPSSEFVKIGVNKKKGQVYPLTDKFSGFTYYANGSKTSSFYGVRTVFTAKDSGMYVIVSESKRPWYNYIFLSDSLFSYASTSVSNTSAGGSSRSTLKYSFYVSSANTSRYFMLVPYNNSDMKDSVWAKVVKTSRINSDTVGGGYVRFAGTTYNYDSTHISGDTISMNAYANTDQRFDHWQLTSGKCTILDSTERFTQLVIDGDCKVKAFFREGVIYPVTATPKSYTTAKDYYVGSPSQGVYLSFEAPQTGTYAIVTSWTGNSGYLQYYRYPDSTYYSYSMSRSITGTFVDTLTMNSGDKVFFKIQTPTYADSIVPFWISYAESKSIITVKADSNGTVSPTQYDPAWIGPKYVINATASVGYRFDSWELVSGTATIDDKKARSTLISIKKQSEVIAHFKKGSVQSISKTKKTFNYQTHYYSDRTGSAVYFTWTPPDSSWYMLQIESTDRLAAKWYDFGTDTTFLTTTSYSVVPVGLNGNSKIFLFRGDGKKPLYWAIVDSLSNVIPNRDFTIQIAVPYVLTVSTEGKGRVQPLGEVGLYPGSDTVVTAVSYGGYIFDKWVKVSGKVDIDDPSNTTTRVKPNSEACEIKATYSLDLATEPELHVTSVDLSEYPGICANVIVMDKNTQKFIGGLDSSDFVLHQDKKALPIHVSSVGGVGGVSVAIVVDESGSMSGTRITQAKQSIRDFINEMTLLDKAAIIGFDGSSSTTVHQTMTSDKSLLLAAVDRLTASGGTNILDGAYSGIRQVVGEMNSTAVIVFSDGYDGGNAVSLQDVIDYAKNQNTVIYTVAVESDIRNPLKDIADGTGGTYTFAPTADQLAEVYISIRNELQAKYTICYETPDTTINGDEHQVAIKTKFINKPASDTAYWSESAMPPLVKLTKNTKKLIGVSQPAGTAIELKVYVVSQDSISSVKVYIRTSTLDQTETFAAYPMVHVKDSLWSYTVPASNVVTPGLDFYVIATNANGMVGKSPQVSKPDKEPYTIPIGNDAPAIEYVETTCVDTTSGSGTLSFEISDSSGISSARLYYRSQGSVEFKQKKMSRESKKGNDWTATIDNSAFGNGRIEFYVRAIDKSGVASRWEQFNNNYVEACKDGLPMIDDVADTIWIKNGEKDTMQITRLTESIKLSLVTEDFTAKKDSVIASLKCLVSGDVEDSIKMVEVRGGYFETPKPLEKNEYSVKKNDGKISCAGTDTLIATYKDPLYGTMASDTVLLGDNITITYQFMDEKCKVDLDSVQTSTSAKYCLKILAPSASLYERDTLKLLMFTDQGDTIRVEAIETEDYSKEFIYKGSFYFVEDSASLSDSLLDAVLDLDTTFNRVVIQGGITSDKSKLRKRDSLVVYTNYVAADFAEIYDSDLDGMADSIRIHFKKPLKKKVASIDTVYWNVAQGNWTNVESKKIHITEDSSWAEAMVRKAFKYGLTAIDTSAPPYLRVTKTKDEFSQKTMLKDKVGAVPVRAVKRPGQITMEEYLDASDDVAPDTLEITMSESIKNTGKKTAWKDLFRYSKTCKDTVYNPIRSKSDPIVDSAGLVWKFVLADYAIMKENCISTNPEATYVDSEGNSMGRGGVEIEGRDETVYLYEVSAVQPVHGIGKKGKWIPQGGNSWEDVPDSLTVIKIASVAPYEANIFIYDNLANVVANMKQKFGDNGEMESKVRGNDKNRAKIGYLTWNHRSNRDRKVATGVYIWRIDFKFKDGHTEYRILKTGYLRREE